MPERLEQIIDGFELEGRDRVLIESRREYDGGRRLHQPQPFQSLYSGQFRHSDVQKHDIRPLASYDLQAQPLRAAPRSHKSSG